MMTFIGSEVILDETLELETHDVKDEGDGVVHFGCNTVKSSAAKPCGEARVRSEAANG